MGGGLIFEYAISLEYKPPPPTKKFYAIATYTSKVHVYIRTVAVLEDSYSEVVVNVIDLALSWHLLSNVGRPQSFVNMMSTNSALDPCLFVSAVLCRMLL